MHHQRHQHLDMACHSVTGAKERLCSCCSTNHSLVINVQLTLRCWGFSTVVRGVKSEPRLQCLLLQC
jgi:hypothetical protein